MTAEEMWALYLKNNVNLSDEYEAWAFGEKADELSTLVLTGKKTATSSAYDLYAVDGEKLPGAGDYSVILDSEECAVCIIRNISVKIVPFGEVDSEFAAKEGEGDGSLEYWRCVHHTFFSECLGKANLPLCDSTPLVLEEFEVVFS